MAKVLFNLEEITTLCRINNLLPDNVSELHTENGKIHVSYNTGLPLVRNIRIVIEFYTYLDGILVMKLCHSGIVDRVVKGIKLLKSEYYSLEYPFLRINIKKILSDKFLGLKIAKIEVKDDNVDVIVLISDIGE